MTKLRKLLIGALISCTAVCASFGIAACKDKINMADYPDYRQPVGWVPDTPPVTTDGEYNGKYVISLKSEGGMSLNNVRVAAKKNGETVMEGISINGLVEFTLDKGVYDIEIVESSLPEGYYLPENAFYETIADKAGVEIALPSSIIPTPAVGNHSYSYGDVMHDFSFFSADGNTTTRYSLSDLLGGEIKAVVLNFWYRECNPCRAEFPAIEEAYHSYSDKIEIVALSAQDTNADIAAFKSSYNLSFHMGYDTPGLTNMFNIGAFPTTVIIDRYGAIAYVSSGNDTDASSWRGLFARFTSDDYSQSNRNPDAGTEYVRTKPTEGLEMSASADIAAAINGVGTAGRIGEYLPEDGKDAEYSWPWVVEADKGETYITATNSKQGFSFSIILTTVTMHSGEALSYDYLVDTETNYDILYSLVNGNIVESHSGNSQGWQTAEAVYVADRTITFELAFIYNKDPEVEVGEDRASLRNITIRPYSEIMQNVKIFDQRIAATDGLTFDAESGKYKTGNYDFTTASIVKDLDDGYYYVQYANGKRAMLLADILNFTLWADKHIGSPVFTAESNTNYATSLYELSFWRASNYADEKKTALLFDYLDKSGSENLIESYYLQGFSDNGYLPVNEARKQMLIKFTQQCYNKDSGLNSLIKDDKYYEDQWLEFCFYYKHLRGPEHDDCNEKADPIIGLTHFNAYTATEGVTPVHITKILNLNDGGGIKFKFVPTESGVYNFYSTYSGTKVDPKIIIFDENGREITENDTYVRYDTFHNPQRDNFFCYVELLKNRTYYIHTTMSYAQDTGDYDMHIEYVGDYVEYLRVCTMGEGMWTYDEDNPNRLTYLAVPVAYSKADGYYRVTDRNGEFGSPVYIDFVHGNYYDTKNNTLYDLIQGGKFDFRANGGRNYTTQMNNYYNRAIAGKDRNDPLYGMIEADATLVNILNDLMYISFQDGPEVNVWLMFGCYYEYYGTKPAA